MSLTDAPIDIDPTEPLQFREAVQWFAAQAPWISGSSWATMEKIAAQKGDEISGAAVLGVLDDTWAEMDRAVADGLPYGDFLRNLADRLDTKWYQLDSPRMGLIYHNNVGSALMAGRLAQMEDPDVLADRPYWIFDGIADFLQSEICEQRDGVCLPASDPWWQRNRPLLHHGCRSSIIAVTYEEALAHGITSAGALERFEPPQDGWGNPANWEEWAPKKEDYHPALFDEYERWKNGQDYISNKEGWDKKWHNTIKEAVPAVVVEPDDEPLNMDAAAFRPVGEMSKPFAARVDATLRIINRVHGVTPGANVPSIEAGIKGRSAGTRALYYPHLSAIQARTSEGNATPYYVIHEYGHHLDYQVMGDRTPRFGVAPGKSAVSGDNYKMGPELNRLVTAILDSQEINKLKALRWQPTITKDGAAYKVPKSYVQYLLKSDEMWARAYTQFIVGEARTLGVEPADAKYLDAADEALLKMAAADIPAQWSATSFEPIADAFRAYFRSLGWMR